MTRDIAGASRSFIASVLILTLTVGVLSVVTKADGRGSGKLSHMPAAAFSPIGKVYSLGEVSINGRRAYGEEMIWCGDVLQVSNGSACAVLDSLGRVLFERGTTLTLTTGPVSVDGEGRHRLLIVSLASGSIRVRLQRDASAYLEMCGAEFSTTGGASFHAEVRENQPIVTATEGVVEAFSSAQDIEYIVEPVIADPSTGRPTQPAPSTRRISPSQPGAAQQQQVVSVQVSERDKKTKKRIKAAGPGRRVTIALLTPGVGELGSQSVTVMTNDFGVATATFTAGPNPGKTKIRATDESGAKWVGKIIVATPTGFWTTQNKILVGAAAAAAIIIFVDKHRRRGPLRQVPPPIIP